MKNFIFILLLISSFQFITSTRKYNHLSQRDLEAFITILQGYGYEFTEEEIVSINSNEEEGSKETPIVDPNDHVNIELWNKLNQEDFANMPIITDYSDENIATNWLKWYLRIAQRF